MDGAMDRQRWIHVDLPWISNLYVSMYCGMYTAKGARD